MRPEDQPNTPIVTPEKKRPLRSKRRAFGLFLIIFALLLGWFLIVALMGWQSGQRIKTERETEALTSQITRQKELAQANISEGNYELALLRVNWVIEQSPSDAEALNLKQEAESGLLVLFTPTPTVPATAEPTSTPLPTPTAGPISSPGDELQRIRRLMATKDWEAAIISARKFQREFPNFERQETDSILYEAYLEMAIDLLDGEDVESGMYYLAQASQLGDLSQSMLDYETWAELYLQGVSFYGANWDASAYYFRDLCLAAPFFQNSCARLQEVLIEYGDQQVSLQEWCPAMELYEEASLYEFEPTLSDKLMQAQEMCASATPTPDLLTPEATVDATSTGDAAGSLRFETPTATPQP